MVLKLAGEEIGIQEKIESITYNPYLIDTADLEAGTHTIVPTARPAIGSAQYNKAMTIGKPSDARVEVLRIAARLSVNIAGLGTATVVNCSVRVDVDDAAHELFNESWNATGAKLAAVDTHAANKADIFNLLKDGAAHTFYFLFWADVASQATIDLVQLWEAVGTCTTTGNPVSIVRISHKGLLQCWTFFQLIGTGSIHQRLSYEREGAAFYSLSVTSYIFGLFLVNNPYLSSQTTVPTDICYLYMSELIFRSIQ